DAVDLSGRDNRRERRKSVPHQREPAAGALDQISAARDRGLVAIDADDPAIGCGQDGARVAAGTERAVDDQAAVAWMEEVHDLGCEHGNVTSRSARGARLPGAA